MVSETVQRQEEIINPFSRAFLKKQWDVTVKYFHLVCTYFVVVFGIAILWPHFTPFQTTLGLSIEHTGLVSVISSVALFILPTLAGIRADKLGNFTNFMSILCFLNGIVAGSFLIFPIFEEINISNLTESGNLSALNLSLGDFNITVNSTENISSGFGKLNSDFIFVLYFIIHLSFMCLNTVTVTLLDSAVVSKLDKDSKFDHCYIRSGGILAGIVAGPLGGFIVEITPGLGSRKYVVIFAMSMIIHCIAAIFLSKVSLEGRSSNNLRFLSSIKVLFTNIKLSSLFIVVILSGAFFCLIETFMYRYLTEELEARPLIIGLTTTVGSFMEFLFLRTVPCLKELIGIPFLLSFGFFFSALRLFGLFLMTSPNFIYLTEALDVFSNTMVLSITSSSIGEIANDKHVATLNGLMGASYVGLGKLVGSTYGTVLSIYTTRKSFWMFSAIPPFTIFICIIGFGCFRKFSSNSRGNAQVDEEIQMRTFRRSDASTSTQTLEVVEEKGEGSS